MGLGNATPMASFYCSEFERKTTSVHPRSRHWHMIDFIITRCRDKMDIQSTRAMRGANCWTDHQMLRLNVAFGIRQNYKSKGKVSRPSSTQQNEVPSAIRRAGKWTVISPSVRKRKAQRRTRNGQLCSSSYTTHAIHWQARQNIPGLVRP